MREGGQDGADDGEGEQNAAPLLAHDARKLGQDKDAEAPAEHLDRKPPRGLDPAHVRRSGDVGKKPQAGRRDRDAEADRYGQSAGNPREQEGAEEKGEQGEGEGARPAGTTRDAVDTRLTNAYGSYLFIDTAGIRKKSKIDDRIEHFSVLRAQMAVDRADVCLIMIDARDGVTEQDTKIAGLAHDAGKACIIVVNKWDLIEKDDRTLDRMQAKIRKDLAYMTYAPIVFISAVTGQRVNRLFETINYVYKQSTIRISTGTLNNILADATMRVQPPTDKGRRLKIYYMTQTGVQPPNFVVFVNDARLFHFSYQRYLENQIRSVFKLEGTPIRMVVRQKGEQA